MQVRRQTSRNAAAFAGFGWEDEGSGGQSGRGLLIWLPAVLFPSIALIAARPLSSWLYMWIVAGSLFAAAKWLTATKMIASGKRAPLTRLLAYLLLWPGLNARAFCLGTVGRAPRRAEAFSAGSNVVCGAILIAIAVRLVGAHWFIGGWLGMVGIVLILHFGLFQLLALGWRLRGVDARPLMREPIKATSVSQFWSSRWNTAFADLMHGEFFTTLARRRGLVIALATVFLASGLLHELVISLPARGGYGGPTGYFALQCIAVLTERSDLVRGRLFTILAVAAPVPILFPPIFVKNVVVPILQSL